ncbi:MAG: T9SS type A sorting domain-containing protein [Candidatus Cloacimonadota bacterium]|nr:T9SS type A sorting domain-containing protein [Candidatus Cloacimonadota bacterium]
MKKLLLVFLIVLTLPLWSQVWDVDQDITEDIVIAQGSVLTISPGVTVTFQGHHQLIIEGQLLAIGTENQQIVFTATNSETGWGGIRFIDGSDNVQDSSKVVYSIFEYGKATGLSPDYRGGAIYANNSDDLLISNSTFMNNSAVSSGGAIYLEDSAIKIYNSIFSNNSSDGTGGAITLNNSDVAFVGNNIYANTAIYDGGGIYCQNSDPSMFRMMINSNQTQWNGGGIAFFQNCTPEIDHLTVAYNTAFQQGSGIACLYNTNVNLNNSIIWGNAVSQVSYIDGSQLQLTYSDIQFASDSDEFWGVGCINQDPLFEDIYNNDFDLSWINYPEADSTRSPCIDAGDVASDEDIDGTRTDMGASPFTQSGIQGIVELVGENGIITDVVITVGDVSTNPDMNGIYLLNIQPGVYDVTASLLGFSTFTHEDVVVADNQTTTGINFTLHQTVPGSIEGIVTLSDLGQATETVVMAKDEFGTTIAQANPVETMVNGELVAYYQMPISAGVYNVTARLAGYSDSTIEDILVTAGQATLEIDFDLQLVQYNGLISGNARFYNNGNPINAENVLITVGDEQILTDSEGSYQIESPQGNNTVYAAIDGYATVSLENILVLPDQETSGVDFMLLDWQVEGDNVYNMIGNYTFTKSTGEFFEGEGNNQIAAFGPSGDCRGVGHWQAGDWDNQEDPDPDLYVQNVCLGPWELPGYWYFTFVSSNNSGEVLIFKAFEEDENGTNVMHSQANISSVIFQDCVIKEGHLRIETTPVEQTFDFNQGWNWISFNLYMNNPLVEDVFSEFVPDDIHQIKYQDASATYFPDLPGWVGDLINVSYGEGYVLDMHNANSFAVTGNRYNPIISGLTLVQGWNWEPFIPNYPLSLEDALAAVEGQVNSIKTQAQSAVFLGDQWIGDLTELNPGNLYKMYKTEEDTISLFYPDSLALEDRERTFTENVKPKWDIMQNTKSNMIYLADISFLDSRLSNSERYNVGIFDEENNCRANGTFFDEFWYFTIVGNIDGEQLSMRVWDNYENKFYETDSEIIFIEDSILGYSDKPIDIRIYRNGNNSTPKVKLGQNYPNPFNPSTTINYFLPEKSNVKISIFNILGQEVEVLENSIKKMGNHSIKWDANKFSSGVYFYKIETPTSSITRKSILLK